MDMREKTLLTLARPEIEAVLHRIKDEFTKAEEVTGEKIPRYWKLELSVDALNGVVAPMLHLTGELLMSNPEGTET